MVPLTRFKVIDPPTKRCRSADSFRLGVGEKIKAKGNSETSNNREEGRKEEKRKVDIKELGKEEIRRSKNKEHYAVSFVSFVVFLLFPRGRGRREETD